MLDESTEGLEFDHRRPREDIIEQGNMANKMTNNTKDVYSVVLKVILPTGDDSTECVSTVGVYEDFDMAIVAHGQLRFNILLAIVERMCEDTVAAKHTDLILTFRAACMPSEWPVLSSPLAEEVDLKRTWKEFRTQLTPHRRAAYQSVSNYIADFVAQQPEFFNRLWSFPIAIGNAVSPTRRKYTSDPAEFERQFASTFDVNDFKCIPHIYGGGCDTGMVEGSCDILIYGTRMPERSEWAYLVQREAGQVLFTSWYDPIVAVVPSENMAVERLREAMHQFPHIVPDRAQRVDLPYPTAPPNITLVDNSDSDEGDCDCDECQWVVFTDAKLLGSYSPSLGAAHFQVPGLNIGPEDEETRSFAAYSTAVDPNGLLMGRTCYFDRFKSGLTDTAYCVQKHRIMAWWYVLCMVCTELRGHIAEMEREPIPSLFLCLSELRMRSLLPQ